MKPKTIREILEEKVRTKMEIGNCFDIKTKTCPNCHRKQPIANFSRRRGNGLQSWCKFCYKEINKSPYMRKYNVKWRKEHQYDSKGFAHIRRNAKQRATMAVKRGALIKTPCIKCGDEKVEGHHDDYAKPLEVIWLCNKHHREKHQKILAEVKGE